MEMLEIADSERTRTVPSTRLTARRLSGSGHAPGSVPMSNAVLHLGTYRWQVCESARRPQETEEGRWLGSGATAGLPGRCGAAAIASGPL